MQLPFYNSKSAMLALVVRGKGYIEMICPHLPRQRQREGHEEGSRGQGQEGQEEGSRGQGQQEGQEEGSRGQGQQEGQEEGSRGQGQEEGSRGQGQQGQEEGSRGQGQEKGQEEGSRGQGQGGQEREEQGNRRQGQGEEEREARIQYEKVRASLSPSTVYYVPPAHPVITVASSDENLQIVYFELFAHGSQRNYLAGRNNYLRRMGTVEAELSYNLPAKEVQEIFDAQGDIAFSKGPKQGRSERESHRALESIMDFMGF